VRLLCLSDIHGRSDALSAVLAAAESEGWDSVLVAGDICFPGPDPLGTWRRLTHIGAVCVQGAGDRALVSVDPATLEPKDEFERARVERLLEIRRELGDAVLRQIAGLPQSHRRILPTGDELLLVHGSPGDPLEPMTHDLPDDGLLAMIGPDPATLVLCGGSHVPFDRTIPRHGGPAPAGNLLRVVNLGSVGESPGADGTGRRFADATFVDCSVDAIEVVQLAVPLGHTV
jgi:predicted phosphodiesterase